MIDPPENLTDFPVGCSVEQYEDEWEAPCGCYWKKKATALNEGFLPGWVHNKCWEHWLD